MGIAAGKGHSVVNIDDSTKFLDIYNKPYCRISAYAIGLAVGFILYSYRRYKATGDVFDPWALKIAFIWRKSFKIRAGFFVFGVGLINFLIFI